MADLTPEQLDEIERDARAHPEPYPTMLGLPAATVLSLLAEVRRLRAEREWIPVEGRLPDIHTTVAVLCRSRAHVGRMEPGARFARLDDDGDWIEPDSLDDIRSVTHWWPLPSPPKALSNEESAAAEPEHWSDCSDCVRDGGYCKRHAAEPTPPDAVDRPVMLSELVEALETIVNQGGILKAGSTGSWFGKLAEELARKAKGQAVMDHQVGSAEYWKERFLRCLSMLEKQQENNAEQFAQLRAAQAEVARLTAENEALRLEVTPRSTIEKIAIQRNIALAGLGLPLNAEPDAIHARVGATTLGAKQLWDLLDRVDSLGDELKPSDLKGYKKFYEISQRVAAKRHNVMTSDGYNLTWTEPTPKGDKEET